MIKLIGKRVAVMPEAAKETTISGLIIPDSAQENTIKAVVLAVGPGTLLADGTYSPLTVKEEDMILFNKKSGYPITSGVNCIIINEDDILVIL